MIKIAFGIAFGLLIYRVFTGGAHNVESGKWWRPNYDATDWPTKNKRSGLTLFIDYGTGCHYIQTSPFQPLQPRLGQNGKQVCEYVSHAK